MFIGYSRVSTTDQNLDLQTDSLKKAGCEKIFEDKISGSKSIRPGLDKLYENIRQGDTVIVWRLDRLGRSLKDLIELVNKLQSKGVSFKSITENIDTSSASGKLIFHIFCSLAEFERSLIKERVTAGLIAAKTRGKLLGRRKGISKEAEKKSILAASLYTKNKWSTSQICDELNISRTTLYKYLKIQGVTLRVYEPKFEIFS